MCKLGQLSWHLTHDTKNTSNGRSLHTHAGLQTESPPYTWHKNTLTVVLYTLVQAWSTASRHLTNDTETPQTVILYTHVQACKLGRHLTHDTRTPQMVILYTHVQACKLGRHLTHDTKTPQTVVLYTHVQAWSTESCHLAEYTPTPKVAPLPMCTVGWPTKTPEIQTPLNRSICWCVSQSICWWVSLHLNGCSLHTRDTSANRLTAWVLTFFGRFTTVI